MTDPVDEFGMVLDNKTDPDAFEEGAGRQFLIKWSSQNYSDATYEFERDLWLMDQKESLMEKLKEYYQRIQRPTRKISKIRSQAEDAKRRCYMFLGDNSRLDADQKEEQVKEYQTALTEYVFQNGGSLGTTKRRASPGFCPITSIRGPVFWRTKWDWARPCRRPPFAICWWKKCTNGDPF